MLLLGIVCVLLASLGAAIHYKSNEYLKSYSTFNKVLWQFLIGIMCVILFFRNINYTNIINLSLINWIYIGILSIVVSLGAYGFMILSVTKVDATITGALDYLEPIIGIVLAILIIGESITFIQILGWIVIMFTLLNINRIL